MRNNRYLVCYQSEEDSVYGNSDRWGTFNKVEADTILNNCKLNNSPCHIFDIRSDMVEEFLRGIVEE